MKRDVKLLFALCCIAVAGVLFVQLFWIRDYFEVNKDRFIKDINIAFEDAVKKEFSARTDTLEELIYQFLNDTSKTKITSKWNENSKTFVYKITDVHDSLDKYVFSYKEFNFPIFSQSDTNKSKVAGRAARNLREEDLDHHFFFYRTQKLGKFIAMKVEEYAFDTARLRPILKQYLKDRQIVEPFDFYLQNETNASNENTIPDNIKNKYPVITKSFPTYWNKNNKNYVRATFPNPSNYLYTKTIRLLMVSFLLILLVGFFFFYLLKIIRKEKKLSVIKNDFINNITHEFKTPIATIYSAVEALDDFNVLEDRSKAKKYLRISKAELLRLSGMVTKILNISLYENTEYKLKKENVDVDILIKELIETSETLSKKPITIKYYQKSKKTIITADQMHLYNIINNLLDNAIKYSKDRINIEITLHQINSFLIIEIKDNGIGIDKDKQKLIFDKFYRAASQISTAINGYGIGLSYVKSIIEKHNGWIKVKSQIGKGSTFIFALPNGYENEAN